MPKNYIYGCLILSYIMFFIFFAYSIFRTSYPVALFLRIMSLKEVLCLLDYNSAESEYSYHIRNSHKSIEDIGNRPHSLHRHIWSDEYGKYV